MSATKQFIISQPSASNNCSKINTTGQSTSSPRPTLTEACAAAQCISSRRLTSTDHASIWSHYMSSMHPESSSYDEYGTCLFSRRPTPTSHKTIWSYHVELTNTWSTVSPLPSRPTVTTHTMVTVTVAPPAPLTSPPPTPLPSSWRPMRLHGGKI